MSRQNPDVGIEKFHHSMADWRRGRKEMRDCSMSKAKGIWCFWEGTGFDQQDLKLQGAQGK